MDLYRAFVDLPLAASNGEFTAIPLGERRLDFLSKTQDGCPVFLLHDSTPASYTPSIELKHLSAQFHNTCRVTTSIGTVEDQFAVVSCDATVAELYELFVRCFAALVEQLPVTAGTSQIRASIQELLDLFRTLSRPNAREITGLWAELFVVAKSANKLSALNAWRGSQFERFDFSWPEGCLEVKATVKESRQHEFALEQLQVPIGGRGFVVSLLLQPMSGGLGVMDLARSIESALPDNPMLKKKLWENIALALGSDFSSSLDRRFDASYAERQLAIFAMNDIPALSQPTNPRITGVRFRADISDIKSSLGGTPTEVLNQIFA